MSLVRLLARRIAMGLLAIWGVLTLVFVLFSATRDWRLGSMLAGAGPADGREYDPDEIADLRESYLAERGLDRPLYEQYFDWMTNMVTLQWGESFETGAEVLPTVIGATLRTGSYVIPALLLATAGGLVVGVSVAMGNRSLGGRLTRITTYVSFGLPNFWLGVMIVAAIGTVTLRFRPVFANRATPPLVQSYELPFVYDYVLPTLLVTSTLLAAVVSYSRAYSLQYVSADLTKLVRAKGGSRLDVARHVLRNAAVPLVSVVFTETLALLALSVVVLETLFGIEGLGLLFYNSVWARDLPMLMGATLVVVAIGVVGNVTQDLAYSVLDPRVDTGSR